MFEDYGFAVKRGNSRLKARPRTTGEIASAFERYGLSRFAVMQHLAVLEEAGLVVSRRKGRERINYLNPVPIRRIYERWVSRFEGELAGSLLRLKERVESQTPARTKVKRKEAHG